ncbi:hypothetical protein FIM10_01835 [Sphingomonadales bacterium 56]|uniref:hypothetical protein n=1 Tax=unclassified Sphingobium TaxID=2611147 RepID=UPI00191A3257|nr:MULTISPECIES: hypothetical protein [unclassified Sphingobium]MBY2927424.1 hypothetical protein [Sphingomonadales bacterium 56]MBY2957492.1 hypothetical protein [Sphingomonadales bacterium 58]MBY2957535.1 hypothetical protein [Sphingomonadales bacterium 58]CAD7335163.1 hypothetical protein SPHS8_00369 [Sphingobium sp. S8]CAD7335182.1 hypothetical protein SPHS6_00369 [Sphingobium sp. S6]
MTDRYAVEQVGVADGTSVPAKKLNGALVGAKIRSIRATKQVLADASTDRVYLGQLPIGATVKEILLVTDTSLGTATIAVGTTAAPAKYVAARTFTAPLDAPTSIGPKASAWDDAPLPAVEDLWLTVGAAAMPGSAIVGVEIRYTISA